MTKHIPNENILTSINNEYFHFTASEKKVSDYILSHRTNVQYMSISELAIETGVAEATISRFCRRLGLSGYNAFKLALAKATVSSVRSGDQIELQEGEVSLEDSFDEMCRKLYTAETTAIVQSLKLLYSENVNSAVDCLIKARNVVCLGQGSSSIIAEEASELFSGICGKFFHISDYHLQISRVATMGSEDVMLFFSYSGSTKELLELLPIAKENGVKTILITRFLKSPGASNADIVLQCGSTEGPLQTGSIPAKMAQFFIIDVLYNEYIRRDRKSALENREKIADALSNRHL